jgi:hypothetical protein
LSLWKSGTVMASRRAAALSSSMYAASLPSYSFSIWKRTTGPRPSVNWWRAMMRLTAANHSSQAAW